MSRIITVFVVCMLLALSTVLWVWNVSSVPTIQTTSESALENKQPEKAVVLDSLPKVHEATGILEAISRLESTKDPKCHSTACRFENFLFGTPLNAGARDAKVAQQKRLIRTIWRQATKAADRDGATTVELTHIQPLIDSVATAAKTNARETDASGFDNKLIVLSPVRTRQYASIAYSLRAILSTQQDSLMEGASLLRALDAESLQALSDLVDAVSLSALRVADRNARERNDTEITAQNMREAWESLLPEFVGNEPLQRVADNDSEKEPHQPSNEEALSLLGSVISDKIRSYRNYNHVTRDHAGKVFLENILTYYALYPLMEEMDMGTGDRYQSLVRGRDASQGVLSAHWRTTVEFGRQVLLEAQEQARENGHGLIRAGDAAWAIDRVTPHEIDSLEDVHFFPQLSDEERVTLESYDCDSYRDLGFHWKILEDALEQAPVLSLVPDPFAAELIAEAISQYGVLLFRLAGRNARNSHAAPRMTLADIQQAQEVIRDRARKHHSIEPHQREEPGFLSAAAEQTSDRKLKFFTDVSSRSGISFLHRSSDWLSTFRRTCTQTLPTFSGGGIAAEDVNNDSHIDLLFVGGAGNALYVADGRGNFSDITETAGLHFTESDGSFCEARQPVIADFDNDGLQDILITNANAAHRLYRNMDGSRFEDVTGDAHLGGEGLIGGPATVFDFDGDGLLDIYIGYFGNYLSGHAPRMSRHNANVLPNRLFRNTGQFHFEDVTNGQEVADSGWAQAVSHTDFDQDGRQDIIVANDFGRNLFLRNLGDGRFVNLADSLGITNAFHSMNVGISDLNGDGFPDIYISNIATLVKDNKYILPDINTELNFDLKAMAGMLVSESDVLYVSKTKTGRLVRFSPSTNIERGKTSTGWAWDAEFFDFDNDGDDDLYVVNGANDYNLLYSMFANVEKDGKPSIYHLSHNRESNVFFVNSGGKLRNVSDHSGADFVANSRSTAYLDWDGDGDLDVAVNNFHAPATMLQNNSDTRGNNWIKIRLKGDVAGGSNRDAIGARMFATTPAGLRIRREIQGGSGYLSMNPKEQHIGLGRAGSVDLDITWPNGGKQHIAGLSVNQLHTIEQTAPAETASR